MWDKGGKGMVREVKSGEKERNSTECGKKEEREENMNLLLCDAS